MTGAVWFALLMPFVILAFALAMERIEQPFLRRAAEADIDAFLVGARPEEVETLVRQGSQRALDRYWNRVRHARRRTGQQGG